MVKELRVSGQGARGETSVGEAGPTWEQSPETASWLNPQNRTKEPSSTGSGSGDFAAGRMSLSPQAGIPLVSERRESGILIVCKSKIHTNARLLQETISLGVGENCGKNLPAMSKPKDMTPEQEAAWLEKERARKTAWRIAHPDYYANYVAKNLEKVNAGKQRWVDANREKVKGQKALWKKLNRHKLREGNRRWKRVNRVKALTYQRVWTARNVERVAGYCARSTQGLSVSYIAVTLKLPTCLLRQHPDLIEAKRELIKANRQLKNQTNAQESK